MRVILDHPYAGAGRMLLPGEGVDVSEEQALRMIDAGTAHRPGEEAPVQETEPEADETRTDQRPQGFGRQNPPAETKPAAEPWYQYLGERYRVIEEKGEFVYVTTDPDIPVHSPVVGTKGLKRVTVQLWKATAKAVE